MIKIKINRVIGARGIGITNANYNSGFNGQPKTLQDGTFMCSDVCTKYADRLFWKNFNQPVLIQKRLKKDNTGKLYAATQEEIIADNIIDSKNSNIEILNNFIDVQNFGATVATKGISLGTTGVVQYTQGINKLDNSIVEVHQILSPYGTGNNKKNKNKEKSNDEENEKSKTATNIGSHTFIDRALYVQGFSITPSNLNNLVEVLGDKEFKGYKQESFELFKKATLCSTTLLSTRNKEGVYDAFAIFINLKEGSIFAFNNIHNYINIDTVADNFYTIDFRELDFLNDINDIESIEIYHNPKICKIKHNFNDVKVMDSLKCL
ncbi:TPA: type I CRISPR-associated protein Cas7 [Clostridium botulinum]|uniref:CRISPR-associated protein Cas7 n=1 Tax=Clostridium botulinum TaxID=1491 RepID=A0A140C2R7_CLOBO|nr:type I CRISPR-associated protein Cas7 [Clostridium botulinum]ALT05661.1 CRISPR-associated protein Cas7 [Clostridium botulinum]ALT05763.1 CRISPR-associated protein Cas7 [Clostridium botulinum]ALT05865.1 CRISPR-associated protein Cas7 [Clostridium botulinum]HBJ2623038.1 type I CRISPR-associated protein Cas7 [Clostridium botulinum]